MCGRFTLTIPDYGTLAGALGVRVDPDQAALYRPRYNVAPTDLHWIVRVKDGDRQLLPAAWGLLNRWAKDASGAAQRINARAETAAVRPAFREAFERRRCVVPTDGFFEWIGRARSRRPIWFHPPAGGLLLLAGLYESWQDPQTGVWRRTFSVITVGANATVAPSHDRMPAVLSGQAIQEWLSSPPGPHLESLLAPAPVGCLAATRVSRRVSSVKHDDAACLAVDDTDDAVLPLFEAPATQRRHDPGSRAAPRRIP